MSRVHPTVLLAAFLVVGACSAPKESEVRQSFQRENPDTLVREVYVSEGDGGAVYFTIKYQDKSTKREHRACWQYLNEGKEEWRINYKHSLPEPAPPRYCQ